LADAGRSVGGDCGAALALRLAERVQGKLMTNSAELKSAGPIKASRLPSILYGVSGLALAAPAQKTPPQPRGIPAGASRGIGGLRRAGG
jgi:hypothetical protein